MKRMMTDTESVDKPIDVAKVVTEVIPTSVE
jgi:hypothetical protein